MSCINGNGSVPSLPPPQPKSPPELYGRRRELAKVQMLEREIGFLEEELKSIEGLQLASRSCKEVEDFVSGNPDPLIPTTKKTRSSCRLWKWLCGGLSCCKVSWICCCSCPSGLKMTSCCCCCCCNCNNNKNNNKCISCGNDCACSKCRCFSCCNRKCFKMSKCSSNWLCCSTPACPTCSCTSCTCYPKCLHFKNICSSCHKSCGCFCYFC